MTLLYIVLATLLGGLASVVIAASLTVAVLGRVVRHLVSLSAGVLLSTALLHVLPEAFASGAPPSQLFATLLGGLLFFFLLEKAELYRHYASPRRRRPPPPPPLRRASRPAAAAGACSSATASTTSATASSSPPRSWPTRSSAW